MRKRKQTEQKEIGRVKLIVDNKKLDLRVWKDTDKYTGFTKRALKALIYKRTRLKKGKK